MQPYIAIPATAALVYRAYSRKSLTPAGILAAFLTAVIHALHPSSVPFMLLVGFFLGGTTATKVKHDIKERLTISASGAAGGEGSRTHIQVLANSGMASLLILAQLYKIHVLGDGTFGDCLPGNLDPLLCGIVANYAAVAADTFSSELGILSKSSPRLITSLSLRKVPPGTNGGVTTAGVLAGAFGAFTMALISAFLLPACQGQSSTSGGWISTLRLDYMAAVTIWGTLGSLLDSILGGLLQASVVDKRTGKVIEGSGGKKVLVSSSSAKQKHDSGKHAESRQIASGRDLLDNNGVNFLMAAIMSLSGVALGQFTMNI